MALGETNKPGGSNIDGLWRRMKQANESQNVCTINHVGITDAMAEARRRERERISVIQLGMDT